MISHPLACLGAAVLATATLTAPAFSQAPAAPAADTKLELEDKAALDAGTVKLDPALPASAAQSHGRRSWRPLLRLWVLPFPDSKNSHRPNARPPPKASLMSRPTCGECAFRNPSKS